MMLSKLIQDLPIQAIHGSPDVDIRGITQDSRKVQKGFLFVAISGTDLDGHQFIPEAVQKGASAVMVTSQPNLSLPVTQLVVANPRRMLAEISARFYEEPSLQMRVIGITGTNGKTTLTYLLESILSEAGHRPAVLGTINYRYGGKILSSENTTPESVDIQRLFSEMRKQGVTDVVMEVSSHALAMDRVYALDLDVGIFTNLSQDHLDFHRDLEEYFQTKLKLFKEILPSSRKKDKFAIVNMEDPRAESLLKAVSVTPVRTGLTGPYEISCRSYRLSENGITAIVAVGSDSLEIQSSLIGRFNLENILLAVAAAHSLGLSKDSIVRGIEKLVLVPGRLERIPNHRGIHLFVDYAHTPEALSRVGENLRKFSPGRLITVFGCGGDRDRSKRPLMGREAALFSDFLIVTSDNPRTENPEAIIDMILPGVEEVGFPGERLFRISSREEALKKALQLARRGDWVLVAGKGHEDYQWIGTKKIHFSDREVLERLLNEAVT